jgi:hypothetical protein
VISIKPHHFIDIITAFGGGRAKFEPHPYGHALHAVAEEVLSHKDVLLQIELGADDICRPCLHNVDGTCDDCIDTSFRPKAPKSKAQWNRLLDERWCARLGIAEDGRLTARELCRRILDCVDDIAGIYREIPPDRVAERQAKLRRGAERFLGE